MSAALYIGRVGALAVALGIGVAIAGVPGLAWAGPEPGSDPADSPGTSQGPSTDPGDSSGAAGGTGDSDLGGDGDSGDPGNRGDADDPGSIAGGMKVDSSGGALTSMRGTGKAGAKSNNKDRLADQPKRRSAIKPKNLSVRASAPKTTAQSVTGDQPGRKAQVRLAPSGGAPSKALAAPQLKQSSTPVVDVTPVTRKAVISSPATATISAAPKPAATTGVSRLLSLVTLSAPTAGDNTTPVSTDSPLFAAFFAAGRQASRKAAVDDEMTARTVDSTQTSLMAAPANSPTSVQGRSSRLSIIRDTTQPTVSLAAPNNGAPVSGTVTLDATASDNVGVANVKFYVDNSNTALVIDTMAPYNVSWNTTAVANGAHTVKAVASDAAGNTATATRTITVANPDTTAPSVSLTGPANGAKVSGTVSLSANASDNVGVSGVKFLVDGAPVGVEDTTSPYGVSWNTTLVSNGTHTLTAVARDAAGNSTTSSTRTVTVANPDITAPSVSLAAPNNGAPVSGTVTLDATASDNVGVANVKFYVDNSSTALVTDTSSPYSASWNTATVANGAHTVKAVASDAAGNTATSTVNVTVDNAKPMVTLTAPNNGAPVSGTVTLSATASDNVGVAGVQFMVDGAALGAEDTGSPYSATWNTTTVTNGTHTLAAVARDAAGNTTTSTVTVTVSNTVQTIPVTVTAIPVNTYPTAVAFSGNNAFVYGGDVIWTIDTRNNKIIDSTALYNEPPVVSPDGKRRYEAGYMSVNVIDNQTNAVVDTIELPNCDECGYGYSAGVQELAISPDGTRVYARHAYAVDFAPTVSAVTVIDTSNNEIVGTTGPIYAKDLEIAVDGRVYAIDEDYYYADVNVYDEDMQYLDTIRLSSYTGSSLSVPTTLAISTDGKHAFAHVYDYDGGGAMTVSVIDTDPASPTYQTETYMTERYSAVSPDGTRLYVAESDGRTITVYDTATNAKVGSFVTDQQANTGPRGVYFAPNGTLYVADPGDNTLYAVTIGGGTVL